MTININNAQYSALPQSIRAVSFVTNSSNELTYGASGNGSTDDIVPINSHMRDLENNGGGVLIFTPGVYVISSAIEGAGDNIQLYLMEGVTIKASASFSDADKLESMIWLGDKTNVYSNCLVYGPGVIDCNSVAERGVYMNGPFLDSGIDGVRVLNSTGTACLKISATDSVNQATPGPYAERVFIRNCIAKDVYEGVEITYAKHFLMTNNLIDGCTGQDGLEFANVEHGSCSMNTVKHRGNTNSGCNPFDYVKNVTISNNVFESTVVGAVAGIDLDPDTGVFVNVTLANNVITGAFSNGIRVNPNDNTATFAAATDVDAATDTLTDTAHGFNDDDPVVMTTDTAMPGGVEEWGIYYVIRTDADNLQLTDKPGGTAIDITSTGTGNHTLRHINVNLSVKNNSIGPLSGNAGSGIYASSDCTIIGNDIAECGLRGIDLCFNGDSVRGILVEGNTIANCDTHSVRVTDGSLDGGFHVIRNNKMVARPNGTTVFHIGNSGSNPMRVEGNEFIGTTASGNIQNPSTITGGTGSAGAGNQYVEIEKNGVTYKVLHDGTV